MNNEIKVLDHGYVKLIEVYGSDERIVEAARMSTNKGFLGWGPIHEISCGMHPNFLHSKYPKQLGIEYPPKCNCNSKPGDEKLLKYLYEHKHMTPFEMAGMIIEIQAPIFVFREWHRHRTQSYNELSARYTPLPNLNYVPDIDRIMINAGASNKQAGTIKDAVDLNESAAISFRMRVDEIYRQLEDFYQIYLNRGVPKELARIILPVGRYSRMRASANLRNWLAFLTLRMDKNAQWEIRQYANVVGQLINENFPKTWELFNTK